MTTIHLTTATATPQTQQISDFDAVYKGTRIRFVEKFSVPQTSAPKSEGRRALFLDRDGVLNDTKGFINKKSDVSARIFLKQIAAIAEANVAGVPVVIVTNQGGIELGKMSPEVAVEIQKAFIDAIEAKGGHLEAIYICPRKNPVPIGENEVEARKPEPGLLMQAAHDFNLDLSKSTGVGDQWSDIVAFKNAGLRNSVLVTLTGRNAEDRPAEDDGIRPDFVVDDLATAVETIVVPDEKPAQQEWVSNRSGDVFEAA